MLLCSGAALALIVGSLFVLEWFRAAMGPAAITIDLRNASMCAAGTCESVSLGRLTGAYPTLATIAFWGALPLALLVLGQCAAKLLAGGASQLVGKLGYLLGSVVFLSAFAAAYLFGPEPDSISAMMGVTVERTFSPIMLLAGTLLAMVALRYATSELVDDDAGAYKPIIIHKDNEDDERLPVTPLAVKRVTPAPTDAPRSKSPSQPGSRTKSPSQQPAVGRTPSADRTKSPSQQPAVARTASGTAIGERTKSPSQQPAVARTASPSGLLARAKSPSLDAPELERGGPPPPRKSDPSDIPARARTSSSGPIDLAARLSGAPLEVAIKQPPPVPVPVPPDQIPVAPESGLVIRKRTASASNLDRGDLDQIPVAPESGLVIRKKTPSSAPAGGTGLTPVSAPAVAMPSIGLRELAPSMTPPVATPVVPAMPAVEADVLADIALGSGSEIALPAGPGGLRGKLNYAVAAAVLTAEGIAAHREDGSVKQVSWDSIVGIIARRLPDEPPYDSETIVDLVSTSGSTLRVVPWTQISGAPLHAEGEERARAFVNLVAARCLDAQLDGWTKIFADGIGHAVQLPSAKTLAAHDERLA